MILKINTIYKLINIINIYNFFLLKVIFLYILKQSFKIKKKSTKINFYLILFMGLKKIFRTHPKFVNIFVSNHTKMEWDGMYPKNPSNWYTKVRALDLGKNFQGTSTTKRKLLPKGHSVEIKSIENEQLAFYT